MSFAEESFSEHQGKAGDGEPNILFKTSARWKNYVTLATSAVSASVNWPFFAYLSMLAGIACPLRAGDDVTAPPTASVCQGGSATIQGSPLLVRPRACGEQRRRSAPRVRCPVHPRACGEQNVVEWAARFGAGSSPRVRRTVLGRQTREIGLRFIPARAGNSRRGARCLAG